MSGLYGRSRNTRSAGRFRRGGDYVPSIFRGSYTVPRFMRPSRNWNSRVRSYGPSRRNRPRPWERDYDFFRTSTSNNDDQDKVLQEIPETLPKVGPQEEERQAEEEELVSVLTVKSIDLHIQENVKNHHTDRFDNTEERERDGETLEAELVVRRAAEFEMSIEFSRPYEKEKDDLHLTFKTGMEPIPKTMTIANIKLEEGKDTSYKPDNWGARIVKKKGNSMRIAVYVPAKCVIGEWEFNVKTVVDGNDGDKLAYKYEYPNDIFILLNPWSKDDACYFSPSEGLDEYVLNDGGALWYGNYRQLCSRGWNFAQFADGVLEASVHLLRKGFGSKVDGNMGNPVYIARAMSKIVNSNDDEGLLTGNWSGNYEGGTRPTAWAGSLEILKQYMKTKKPVDYGQCWVFSGVLTTVCRAIGLPCRSVTNFASAHDTDLSCTVDTVFCLDDDGELEKVKRHSSDSVWNFHVWNEVWMQRNDLPAGYDGWQVIDATPQERSDGFFRLGPAPVVAVKKGEINIGYDTPFVYGEVNADSIEWLLECGDEYYVLGVNKDKIGKSISTKKANGKGYRGFLSYNEDREDLTDNYKFREGTKEEREAMELAHNLSNSGRNPYLDDPIVEMTLDKLDGILTGEDFEYKVSIKNTGKEDRIVRPVVHMDVTTYFGKTVGPLMRERYDETTLKGGETKVYAVKVTAEHYLPLTVEHFSIEVTASCFIRDQGRRILAEDVFRLRRPDISIEAPETCKPDETVQMRVYFVNPLNKPLTDCRLKVEGSLRSPEIENGGTLELENVPAKGKWERKFSFTPKKKLPKNRECDLYLSFDCKELPDIVGYHILQVSK